MKKNAGKKMRGPTLQEFELVPITDPAEIAELDRRCKEAEKAMKVAEKAYEKAYAAALRKAGKRKSRKRK
ncbi:MAG TPA: hypothetical protein VMG10_07770 [Gemmataceae bacterium]|nr:hypothetical protein [Gemmataceae bacterium]